MKVAIIDADLLGRKKHRFPNLACEKIAGYHKAKGDEVVLLLAYEHFDLYDKVYLAKVFTDTKVPQWVLKESNVQYGGTGFFYDKAPNLEDEIEHSFPDYHLYDAWIQHMIENGHAKASDFKIYTDYSIGFLTRGCFRQCPFCVNKNYNRVTQHSPLEEFYDSSRKKIVLLDDNFLGSHGWKDMLHQLQATRKPFQFKQGLDERLLTAEVCKELAVSKYDGELIFAFDNIADADIIKEKLRLLRTYTDMTAKFYCLCGFDRAGRWDESFWKQDILDLMVRIRILLERKCLPYVMRYARYEESPYRGLYITIARWCNQPNLVKKLSLREFVELDGVNKLDWASKRYLEQWEHGVRDNLFDVRFGNK